MLVVSGGFLELHMVFGGCRAGEAAWLRLPAELLFRAPLHLQVISCNLLLASLVFSKVYMHDNKLEQGNKWPGTPGLAYSQKRSTFKCTFLLTAGEQDVSLIFWIINRVLSLKQG